MAGPKSPARRTLRDRPHRRHDSVGSNQDVGFEAERPQYSPFITKYEPRIVPASFVFCRANLNELSSAGTSIPSESFNPTARFFGSSSGYRTLIESPLS